MISKEAFELLDNQLPKGAFLTVKNNDEVNTMVIGWATVGKVWGKDVMTFTVSVPALDTMKEEIAFMGTKSGRDFDKYKETNLHLKDSKKVSSPIIEEAKLHFECKIIYKQAMDPMGIVDKEGIEDRFYEGNNDYHVIFYANIEDCYEN